MTQEACPNCFALYEVTMHEAPMPDVDHFDCEVCGERLKSWKSNRYPEYRLIRKPDKNP